MAKKGSKFSKYSYEFKLEVVEDYLSGRSGGYRAIATKYGLKSKRQVEVWVKLYQEAPQRLTVETRGRKHGIGKSIKLEEMSVEKQNEYLRMENDILKKLKALRSQYGEH